jgi:Protein kinase domain
VLSIKKLGDWHIALDARLGKGGFSQVFRARNPDFGTGDYAIKVFSRKTAVNNYMREVENLGLISDHRFTASIIDHGVNRAGELCIVTQLIDGIPLSRHIRRYGPLDAVSTRKLVKTVLSILRKAHRNGITHLDVQAPNILLSNNSFYLVDWGIGRPLAATRLESVPTNKTIAAPEQFYGDFSEATDFYCLGWLAVFALTGQLPFYNENAKKDKAFSILAHCFAEPELDDRVGDPLRKLIVNWLQKDPEKRLIDYNLSRLLELAGASGCIPEQHESVEGLRSLPDFLAEGARRDVPYCQDKLASMFLDAGDEMAAEHWLRRASELGFARSSRRLALLLDKRNPDETSSEVCQLLCHAAEQGDNLARYHAAKRILTARCSGDDAKGLRYARMAADAGERNAQFLIGCRLMSLEGEQDLARRYLQMAAARGHSGAKSRLAEMLTP